MRQLVACRDDSLAFLFNVLQFPAGRAVLTLIHSASLDYHQLAHTIRALGWGMRAWQCCGRCAPLPRAAAFCLSGELSTGDAALGLRDAAALRHPGHCAVNDCQAVRRSPRKGVSHDKDADRLADGFLRHGHLRVRQSGMGTGRRAAGPGLGHEPIGPTGELWQLPWRGGGNWGELPQ
jgi:hypothetical protein